MTRAELQNSFNYYENIIKKFWEVMRSIYKDVPHSFFPTNIVYKEWRVIDKVEMTTKDIIKKEVLFNAQVQLERGEDWIPISKCVWNKSFSTMRDKLFEDIHKGLTFRFVELLGMLSGLNPNIKLSLEVQEALKDLEEYFPVEELDWSLFLSKIKELENIIINENKQISNVTK